MENKLKIALCILVIALISVIAFAGVYTKDLVSYESKLPGYLLDSELTGKRVSYFELSDETEEKIYDKDGNLVGEIPEDANKDDYKTETVKVNSDEAITEENFKKVKTIFEGRLKEIGVDDYKVRVNKESGEVVVELANDENTDTNLQYLLLHGDFTITDTDEGTILIDRNDVKKASVVYSNTNTGEVTVYLDIKFTQDGSKKLEDVSKQYLKVENEDDEQKTVTMTIEGSDIIKTYFGEPMLNGELTISLGSGKDNETVYQYANQAGILAMIINNGEMPLKYTISTSEFITSRIGQNSIYVIIATLSTIVLLLTLYIIMKFKVDGLFAGLSFISAIAMLLLFIRYTKTTLSLGAFAGIAILILIEVYFIFNILNRIKNDASEENVRTVTIKTYLDKLDVVIVFLVIAVVFTFMPELKIFSIGMTLFYGIISLAIANLVFLRTMLIANHK